MAAFDIVFEGGGAKGVAFLGALEVLEERGHTIRRVMGTSAGAITAALVAARFSNAEIREMVLERHADEPRFQSFLDKPARHEFSAEMIEASETILALREMDFPFVPDWMEKRIDRLVIDRLLQSTLYSRFFSLVERGGYYSGRTFLQWLQEKLALRKIRIDTTLAEMNRTTGSDLSVVVSDTTGHKMLVLNHRTSPDVPVCWAVRMSMSIPFVWPEVIWRKEWGLYRGRDICGHAIVDGGALSNFPIKYIAVEPQDSAEVREVMGDTHARDAGNLGLMIDEESEVPGQPPREESPSLFSSRRTIRRAARLLDTMMGAHDSEYIHHYQEYICRLPARGYGTLEFDLRDKRLSDFVDAARAAMTKHLDRIA